ncbi:hypothetical protein KCU65_g109, partial [Aureobasidium melanogenum]
MIQKHVPALVSPPTTEQQNGPPGDRTMDLREFYRKERGNGLTNWANFIYLLKENQSSWFITHQCGHTCLESSLEQGMSEYSLSEKTSRSIDTYAWSIRCYSNQILIMTVR